MKKIAVEEHFHTDEYIEYLHTRTEFPKRDFVEEKGKKFVRDWWSPTKYRLLDPDLPNKNLISDLGEIRLKVMDEAGIDMQVLSLSFPGVELFEVADGTAMAKVVNDRLSKAVKQYPERFAGFAALAPQDPNAAADELERAVKKLGLKGGVINGNIRGNFLTTGNTGLYLNGRKSWMYPSIFIQRCRPPTCSSLIWPIPVWPVL